VNGYEKTKQLVSLSEDIALVVHETQKERGMSAGFLGSKGEKFGEKLAEQRKKSDEQFNRLSKTIKTVEFSDFDPFLKEKVDSLFKIKEQLGDIRQKVSSLGVEVQDVLTYYGAMHTIMLDIVPLPPLQAPTLLAQTRLAHTQTF